MIIAAAKTGVISASIRIAKSNEIVINGNKPLLFLSPGILNVLLVINKFVNDIVVLIPAKITDKIAISCDPIPVYFVLDEKGVTNAQPDKVSVRLEHFVKNSFFRRNLLALLAKNQNESA
jgi:hypothetical protein